MSYLVVDLETTTRCPVGDFKANPMWPDNKIVWWGQCANGVVYTEKQYGLSSPLVKVVDVLDNLNKYDWVLVGHNLKFDLLYMLKEAMEVKDVRATLPEIWDTQLAEYLLTGQQVQYASLDECAIKYGGTVKDSEVKEMFEAGVPVEDIPKANIVPYLEGDVLNTELVFKHQIAQAAALGMLPFIKTQMAALKATTLMNYYGMCVDHYYINEQVVHLTREIVESESAFTAIVKSLVDYRLLPDKEYLISSGKDLSMIFFGADYKYKESVLVGKYKNGKDKYKLVDMSKQFVGLNLDNTLAEKNKNGYFSVDETVLKNIKKAVTAGSVVQQLVNAILTHRTASKQKETYYENIRRLSIMGYVYPSVHHTATKTGRLSCSNPNLQNQTTDGGVKKAFKSRWTGGQLVELDYSQLEMVALAILSGDEQLIADIKHGVDMHSALYEDMHGRPPTKDERKPFKRLSFGLVYGAGYKTLALNADCSETEAKTFINTFYTRYQGVAAYHKRIVDDAKAGRKSVGEHDKLTKMPIGQFVLKSSTGRQYVFREYINEVTWGYEKGKKKGSFSSPELKNWPVQGFATGDIVPMMVGILSKKLYNSKYKDVALLVMTVHDSVLLDVQADFADEVAEFCKTILEDAPKYVVEYLNTEFPLPLKVEALKGSNWLEQEPI